jgi:hypothetical protein
LGSPAMYPADVLNRPVLQQQQGVNPFPDESNAANASLETTKLSVY